MPDDSFELGRMFGELIQEVKGLRTDLNDRHENNLQRFDELEARVDGLWKFRAQTLAVLGMIWIVLDTIDHFGIAFVLRAVKGTVNG